MNVVLVIPAVLLDKANALGEAMGWGPNNYSIPLSADGSEPATHWSLNIAEASPDFLAMLEGAAEGQMPQGLEFPGKDFAQVVGGLTVWTNLPHNEAVEAMGLRIVEPKE